MKTVSAQQVSWWDVHTAVAPWLEIVGSWATVGTPQWVALPDGHPAKVAGIYDAARHWALRLETCQEQRREVGRAIAGPHHISCATWGPEEEGDITTTWAAISREVAVRSSFYGARPWLKRAAS